MHQLLKFASYILHPIFISFLGVGLFYVYSAKYHPEAYVASRLLQLFILTIIIPLLSFRVLKKLGVVKTIMAEDIKERRFPYFIAIVLNLYIAFFIFNGGQEIELRYFFFGISFTSIIFFFLSLLNFKASLHMAAISGLTTFLIGLSIHFQTNMVPIIGTGLLINGLIASSRLHLKAHNVVELIIGCLLGILPQFMMFAYWL